MKEITGGVCAPQGFVAGGVHCGIRRNHAKKDLAIVLSQAPCAAAAVYTRNKVYGAPITVTRNHIAGGQARAVICNSGNANTCNHDGVEKAVRTCQMVGEALGIDPRDVIIASTGVIGQPIDLAPIEKGIGMLKDALSPEGALDAAQAIMTTDLKVKQMAVEVEVGGKAVRLGAMAKGSGMIRPNMATMLSFITTDCAISAPMLDKALHQVVEDTYNMVSVDGDTSTNDMVSIMANGLAGNAPIREEGPDFDAFCQGLRLIAAHMARMIAADGEGATKLLECQVSGAPDKGVARGVAKSIVMSSLVKAAMFGADANWGRVLCAMGYSKAPFRPEYVDMKFTSLAGEVPVCEKGTGLAFDEELAKKVLSQNEVVIDVCLNEGEHEATCWGCDLTYDYVKINGDYRS